ncbi:divergent polysaccharide deacetylase family protein [Hansschlegelia zhihuaiae]|uniref:Divergent polysaccharide deacetylase family protein n=1 Tax=Hansschlegelia zhihuaiae TaxID=405005 RepID=A0A4Q0MNX3_9HYPH|nr:divergent polysaccharide deacetylase family protein [Hansschlegelia zhihuaiae]RXF75538.1 divergent polysaccharide deacetylase family protein [Hansschlegelia zhihuaiae]
MTQDELKKPLAPKAATRVRRAPRLGGVAALALASCGALGVVAAWALFVTDPLGGEPVATASIERRTAAPLTQTAAAPEPEDPQPKSRDGVPIVRPGDPMPKAGPVIIRVPGADDPSGAGAPPAKAGEVQTAMLEESRHGQLPRIAADGRRPLDAYARAVRAAGPKVALVVAGLGVGREATAEALKTSPEVTLAFSPYGSDVADFVEEARKAGHEVLIQTPMEPFAYPSNDPGPQTLLTSLPAPANLDRLRWALGRARGYVGVAPLSGAKFLQSDDALAPVFTEIARRGLMFLGQAGSESRFGAVAERAGLAFARAGTPIDAVPDAAAIDAALAALERDAKANGTAVGWAGSSPLTLKRIEAWRTGLKSRGVTLTPVTAALKSPGPS